MSLAISYSPRFYGRAYLPPLVDGLIHIFLNRIKSIPAQQIAGLAGTVTLVLVHLNSPITLQEAVPYLFYQVFIIWITYIEGKKIDKALSGSTKEIHSALDHSDVIIDEMRTLLEGKNKPA